MGSHMSARRLIAVVLILAGAGALAEPRPVPISRAGTFGAIGWLGWAGEPVPDAGCSAVLVAADLALTAAHCVSADEVTPPEDPSGLSFHAGWRAGRAVASAHVAEVHLPARRTLLGGALPYDMALVRLDTALPLPPLGLSAELPALGARVVTVGYDRTHPRVALEDHSCVVTLRAPPVIGLSCGAIAGFSGGAVLIRGEADRPLAAIMVATGTGADRIGTYAVAVPEEFLAVIGP